MATERRAGFGVGAAAHNGGRVVRGRHGGFEGGMVDLKRPLLVLAVVGSLVACGDNTDFDRGTTECGSAENIGDCADREDSPGMGDDG